MRRAPPPFVSVVTPFYNTARYLGECIESVLAQTYVHFEYVLLDNCSDDGGGEIAESYARRDPRIRVERNGALLPQLANFNRGVSLSSPQATYVKLVLADDWLEPQCLARMVDVAEADPEIVMVCGLWVEGGVTGGLGLPTDRTSFDGAEPCRRQLRREGYFFGSPTVQLFRRAVLDRRPSLFDEQALHADMDVGFDLLADGRFGFVHDIVAGLRVEDDSITGRIRGFNHTLLGELIVAEKYADRFLPPTQATRVKADLWHEYRRFLGHNWLAGRDPRFWAHHERGLATIGRSFTQSQLALWSAMAAWTGAVRSWRNPKPEPSPSGGGG